MSNILITFLGTGRYQSNNPQDDKASIDKKGEYEETTYSWAQGKYTYKSSFFAEAATNIFNVDKSIVIGTKQSMWDEFFSRIVMGDRIEEINYRYWEYLNNIKISPDKEFYREDIENINATCREKDNGYELYLLDNHLTGKNQQKEFSEELSKIIQKFQNIDVLYYDITHSFRHIPILSFPVIMLYRDVFKTIKNIEFIYGMFEGNKIDITAENEKISATPIVKLHAFNEFLDMLKASDNLVNYNDSGSFIKLLNKKVNKSIITDFSSSINSGLLDKIIDNYNRACEYTMPDTALKKEIYNEFIKEYQFISGNDLIETGVKLSRKYLETFRLSQAILMISQLMDHINYNNKRIFVEYFNGIIDDKLNISENIIQNIRSNYENNSISIETLIDALRNRIAHPVSINENVYSYEKSEQRNKSINNSNKILNAVSVSQITDIVEAVIGYCEKCLLNKKE